MIRRVLVYYGQHRLDQTAPYPGIPDLLDELTNRGLPMAILTNKPDAHTQAVVAALFSRWTFTAIEGYREEARRKPDPRTAIEIVQRMGPTPNSISPKEVLMVGDSRTDILTAINAGLTPIGATWGLPSARRTQSRRRQAPHRAPTRPATPPVAR